MLIGLSVVLCYFVVKLFSISFPHCEVLQDPHLALEWLQHLSITVKCHELVLTLPLAMDPESRHGAQPWSRMPPRHLGDHGEATGSLGFESSVLKR